MLCRTEAQMLLKQTRNIIFLYKFAPIHSTTKTFYTSHTHTTECGRPLEQSRTDPSLYYIQIIQYKVMKNLMPSHYHQITHDGSSGTTIVLNLPRDSLSPFSLAYETRCRVRAALLSAFPTYGLTTKSRIHEYCHNVAVASPRINKHHCSCSTAQTSKLQPHPGYPSAKPVPSSTKSRCHHSYIGHVSEQSSSSVIFAPKQNTVSNP